MATLGFVVVLVVDVSATVLGQVKLGEVTVTEVWAKVVDRVLDRDVPAAPRPVARPSARPVQPAPIAPASASSRAPLPAPRPDEYDKHVQPAADPDVEAARKRLDELLKRL